MKRFIGLILIVGGILVLLSNMDLFIVEDLISYLWPSALILLGLASIIEHKHLTIWGLILIGIGGLFLADAFGILAQYNLNPRILVGPAILIAVGLGLLFGKHGGSINIHIPQEPVRVQSGSEYKSANTSSKSNYTAFLSGIDERVIDEAFATCEVTALLGGADMDFRDVKFAGNEATLNLNAIFGSIECLLPKDIKIVQSGTPILGGFENRCISDPTSARILYIRYTAMFGSVEIKN